MAKPNEHQPNLRLKKLSPAPKIIFDSTLWMRFELNKTPDRSSSLQQGLHAQFLRFKRFL